MVAEAAIREGDNGNIEQKIEINKKKRYTNQGAQTDYRYRTTSPNLNHFFCRFRGLAPLAVKVRVYLGR